MADVDEAVRVSVPGLVRLSRPAGALELVPGRVRAHSAGAYLSRFKGRGMEYDESRPYEPGDDARNLHWRVMARTGKPFTKQFREERERPVFIWVDLRARMHFGTRGALKSVVAARAAALIAWAANRHGDRVGGVIFSDGEHSEVKPGRGRQAVLYWLRQLAGHPGWARARAASEDREAQTMRDAMIRLRRVARPGSLVFLLSDFAHLDSVAEANLARIGRHSEVALMLIHDALERDLPPPGQYRFSDGDAELVLDAANAGYRDDYARRFDARHAAIQRMASRYRMTLLDCRTDDDPLTVLQRGLGARRAA